MKAFGSDPELLSFLHCFFTYRNSPQATEPIDNLPSALEVNSATALSDYLHFLVKDLEMDLDEQDVNGKTALCHMYAIVSANTTADSAKKAAFRDMKTLIELGAQLDLPVLEHGRTLLLDAALHGNVDSF